MTWRASKELMTQIHHFASFPQTSVSLQQMVQFGNLSSENHMPMTPGSEPSPGTLLRASQFLAEELPVRLAHRVKDLDHLPDKLHEMPSIQKVKNWYAQSFEELTAFPKPNLSSEVKELLSKASGNGNGNSNGNSAYPAKHNPALTGNPLKKPTQNLRKAQVAGARYYGRVDDFTWPPEVRAYNNNFTKALSTIKRRHDPVVTTMAQGILEYKKHRQRSQIDSQIQSFLDRFYMSRIGIRMLIGQHIALNNEPARKDYVGIICTRTNVQALAQEAIDNARFICEDYYGLFDAPKVQLICRPDLEFMYVPGLEFDRWVCGSRHLSHICFEVLKNALRAVVEKHGPAADHFPSIKMLVAEGEEDITIKIADEGGGIPRSAIPRIWTYMYTTAESQDLDPDFNKSDFKAPMAGFGYGLPLSRLYARYFGGDLRLESVDGHGTDVYMNLNRLSSSREPLM